MREGEKNITKERGRQRGKVGEREGESKSERERERAIALGSNLDNKDKCDTGADKKPITTISYAEHRSKLPIRHLKRWHP